VNTDVNDFAMRVATGTYGESLDEWSFERSGDSDRVLEGESFF
jgi:hypothetical protein